MASPKITLNCTTSIVKSFSQKKNSVMINSETTSVKESSEQKGIMERLSAKISRTSVPPVVKEEEEVIKFKLVEDIRLVTIPITSCLCVLLSYLAFGAILFAHWEVRISNFIKNYSK